MFKSKIKPRHLSHQKQSQKSISPSPVFVGLNKDLPILLPPGNKDYRASIHSLRLVKECFSNYFVSKYGDAGTFVETGKFFEPPEPRAPTIALDPNDYDSVLEHKIHEADCLEWVKEKRKLRQDEPKR
jgi:hypothetical protein